MLREHRLGWQAMTPEQHVAQAKAQYAAGKANLLQHQSAEARKAASKKAVQTMGPEGLSARSKKGRETLRLRKLAEREAAEAELRMVTSFPGQEVQVREVPKHLVVFFKNKRYELPFIAFILVNSKGERLC